MTFNWSEYLDLARELTGKDTTPASQSAKLRSAISRSYYAAFIQARNFLRAKVSEFLVKIATSLSSVSSKIAPMTKDVESWVKGYKF